MPRRSYYSKAKDVVNTAEKALKIATAAAEMLNCEIKYKDQDITIATSKTGSTDAITPPSIGHAQGERSGDQWRLKSIKLNGHVTVDNAAPQNSWFRIILYVDYQNNVDVTDLLESTGSGQDVFSYLSFEDRGKRRILFDRTYHVEPDTNEYVRIKYTKYFKQKFIQRVDTGTNNLNKNALKIACITNDVASGSADAFLKVRTTFVDN